DRREVPALGDPESERSAPEGADEAHSPSPAVERQSAEHDDRYGDRRRDGERDRREEVARARHLPRAGELLAPSEPDREVLDRDEDDVSEEDEPHVAVEAAKAAVHGGEKLTRPRHLCRACRVTPSRFGVRSIRAVAARSSRARRARAAGARGPPRARRG